MFEKNSRKSPKAKPKIAMFQAIIYVKYLHYICNYLFCNYLFCNYLYIVLCIIGDLK